ncbi:MAG: glycosyltransferase [Paludibacteraceae bacterium]|nr:glycosyltransferase [Paludibacteraceae bacterium]MBQ6764364.1 glycosyltransferase [Paludibacteraceae bacterium]
MNILFVTNKNVYPLIGGIERITYSVAEALQSIYDFHCYSLYTQENQYLQSTESLFIKKECISVINPMAQIVSYIKQEKIDVVIAQGSDARVNRIMPLLHEAVAQCEHVELLYAYHTMPGFELTPMDIMTLWYRIFHNPSQRGANIKLLLIQLCRIIVPNIAERLVVSKYKEPYLCADKVIVLSDGYVVLYNHFAKGDIKHYITIPNMLSFLPSSVNIQQKQNEVLVVARMEERAKRIKTALKIWKKINNPDWKLNIVGYGEDLEYYKHLATEWNLKNISFEGLQNPLPYYQKASIFLMTSAFEGWGLTITEAQQYGCVPIAFDSYSAVHDIIQSGRNGYIIQEGDIDAYAAQLKELMNNDQLRNTLAQNAIKDVQRFSRENVAVQWKTLLESL